MWAARWLIDGALVNPVLCLFVVRLVADMVIAVTLHAETVGRGAVVPDHGPTVEEEKSA